MAGQAKAAVCGACHNPDGNSVISVNPKLAGQGAKYLAKQLHDFKSGKRANPVMMGMAAGLSDQDILDIAAYFSAQKSTTNAADPAQVAAGEKVWRGGNQHDKGEDAAPDDEAPVRQPTGPAPAERRHDARRHRDLGAHSCALRRGSSQAFTMSAASVSST